MVSLSTTLALLCLAAGPAQPAWTTVRGGAFSQDGKSVRWYVESAGSEGPDGPGGLDFTVLTDSDGSTVKVYRPNATPDEHTPEAVRKLFASAASFEDGERLGKAQAFLDKYSADHEPLVGDKQIAGGKLPLTLTVVSDRQKCPTRILVARLGSASGAVAEDACVPGQEEMRDSSFVTASWSPDGERAAIAWNLELAFPPDSKFSEAGTVSRGHLVVVSRRALASVDLLDAGAGKQLDALADKLAQANFRVGHRGKASTPRKKIELYFAPGFEPEAKELVKLLGLPESAAQPLTWKTPYSLTIAAGSGG